jgi:hypothetical protein
MKNGIGSVNFAPGFFRFAALCALLSAITTFGVHLIPVPQGPLAFDAQVALHQNNLYIARLWVVLLHILLVVASLWGLAAAKLHIRGGLMGLGFLGYLLFAVAELARTSFVLFALNRGWRAQYAGGDASLQDSLRPLLLGYPSINNAFFFLMVVGFLFGNLFYGIAFLSSIERPLDRVLGIALLIWAGISLITLLRDYAQFTWVPELPEWVSWTYQPAVRVLIAVWLWNFVRAIARPNGGVLRS